MQVVVGEPRTGTGGNITCRYWWECHVQVEVGVSPAGTGGNVTCRYRWECHAGSCGSVWCPGTGRRSVLVSAGGTRTGGIFPVQLQYRHTVEPAVIETGLM